MCRKGGIQSVKTDLWVDAALENPLQGSEAATIHVILVGGGSKVVRGQVLEGAGFERTLICATNLWLFRGASL